MELISSARSTTLSDFSTLETKFVYYHQQNEANDFQFFTKKRLFIEVNKKSGLEFLRISAASKNDKTNVNGDTINAINNDNGNNMIISRVRKMGIENLYCVACPKKSYDELALGLSNGLIKLIDYKTTELKSKFAAESRNSVISLDFNASDEYLSSVYENGIINIYGMKTKTKLETINIDSNATLAKFNPVKKFHLSIASYKGSVFIYDIQANRKIYQTIDGHAAPCRDLSMSSNQPDLLFSVGYDCYINIYDTRKKIQPQKIKCEHPLSTIAISECGNYFCVGNLKGELISYDLRNLKNYIIMKKLYDSAVIRVAFAPKYTDRQSTIYANTSTNQYETVSQSTTERKSILSQNTNQRRDSFCDFLDFHTYKGKDDQIHNKFTGPRESFDWESLKRKKEPDTIDSEQNIKNKSNDVSDILKNVKNSIEENINNKSNEKELLNIKSSISLHKITLPEIKEVDQTNENINEENNNFINLPNSTPNNNYNKNNRLSIAEPSRSVESYNIQYEILKELKEMRQHYDKRFQELEFEIKFNAENHKWNIFAQNFNLFKEQDRLIIDIKDSVDCLIQTDDFYQEFLRLKMENDELKNKLLELSQKKFIKNYN